MEKSSNLVEKAIILIMILIAVSVIAFFFTKNLIYSFRIVFGSVFVLFLPGFILSYIFFPKTRKFEEKTKDSKAVDLIERLVLSFALSIAIVPLAVFYLNLIGLKINALNIFFTILGICFIGLIILVIKNRKS
jgi:uncharacterized membrane protein